MRRNVFVAVVVVLAALVAVAPAEAAHSVSIQYSTEAEFESGSFSNAEVVGTADDAFVRANGGYLNSAVARYAMDAGSGTTAYDSVGSNDGSLTGASWSTGIRGEGLKFTDGDYATIPSGLVGTSGFTASAWINPDGDSLGFYGRIIDLRGDVNAILARTGSTLSFYDGSWHQLDVTVPAGQWTHVAMAYDGSTLKIHVNGAVVHSKSVSISSAQGTSFFGGTDTGEILNGDIDEVRIFAASVSDSQVSALYNNPTTKLGSTSTISTYTSDGRAVEGSTGGSVDLEMQNTNATVTWEGSSDGGSTWQTLSQATYSTGGTQSQSWSEFGGDRVRVRVEFQTTNSNHYARLIEESIEYQAAAPVIDNSTASPDSPSETVGDSPTLSVDVSDPDFATPQGDSLTAAWFVDGEKRGETPVTSNGQISYDVQSISAGSHTWHVEVTDEQGHTTTSATFDINIASQLRIYNEAAPADLVDNATVEVQYFFDESNPDQSIVVQRETSNGVVNMTGLPAAQPFIVVADAEGYQPRRIYVESLFDQQQIYLLPDNKTSVGVRFKLRDYSGRFPADETIMKIQRPLNGTWQTVHGDRFGSTGEFPATLAYNERHRLILVNTETGRERVVGPYTPLSDGEQVVTVNAGGEPELPGTIAWLPSPATQRLTATENVTVGGELRSTDDSLSEWTLTAYYGQSADTASTVLGQKQGTAAGGGSFSVPANLTDRGGGVVVIEATYTTENGTTQTRQTVYRVAKVFENQYGLLNTLQTVPDMVGTQSAGLVTTLLSVIISIGLMSFAGSGGAPTEATGAVGVIGMASFGVIGWIGYGPVFATGAIWTAMVGLRRVV